MVYCVMRNFKLIRDGVDTKFIQLEVTNAIQNSHIANDFGSILKDTTQPHAESRWVRVLSQYAIFIQDHESDAFVKCSANSQFVYQTELCAQFPKTIYYLKAFAKERHAKLQRVIFAWLAPNADVQPHVDAGEYFKYRDRYHIVLQSPKGSECISGGEKQIFNEGQLWWFENKELHSVKNLNDTLRLHVIFDLLPNTVFNWRGKFFYESFGFFFQNYCDTFGKDKFSDLIASNQKLRDVLIGSPSVRFLRT